MTEQTELVRAKKSRAGHRASASKTMQKVEEELTDKAKPNKQKLQQFKQSLQLKLHTLDALNEIILKQIEEDAIEEEIEGIDAVREKIDLSLLYIEDALSQLEEARLSTLAPFDPVSKSTPHTVPVRTGTVPATTRTVPATTSTVPATTGTRPPGAVRISTPDKTSTTPATGTARGGRIHTGTTPITTSTLTPKVKLPKLTMKTFDGNIMEWTPFWNQYQSAIHDNPSLNDVDKFNYLHSYLEGKAADSIRGMAITAANYPEAIAKLQRRFGDNQPIVEKHVDALLHLPTVRSSNDVEGLRRLIDTVDINMASLKALGEEEQSYSGVVTSVIMGKLPTDIRLTVTRELGADIKRVRRLLTTIEREIATRERCNISDRRRSPTPSGRHQQQPTAAAFLAGARSSCPFCDEEHPPQHCKKATTPVARANILKRYGKCFNCFQKGHLSKECRAKERCSKCGRKHHSTLCRGTQPERSRQQGGGNQPRSAGSTPRDATPTVPEEGSTPTQNLLAGATSPVLLQTAKVKIYNPDSDRYTSCQVRAVLDSGSQRSYLSQEVATALHLTSKGSENLTIQTFGSKGGTKKTCDVVELALQTLKGGPLKIEVLVVPFMCEPLLHQASTAEKAKHPHLRKLKLADSSSIDDQLHIELLIGADHYWKLVTGNIRRGASGPTAIQTRVGWVLSGPTESQEVTTTSTNLVFTSTHILKIQAISEEDRMEQQLQKFWDLESMGVQEKEPSVQDRFTQTIRQVEGRYEVQLPWKETHRPLPTNLHLSKKRLQSLLTKLKPQPELLQEYNRVIQEQLQRGIVEVVPLEEQTDDDRVHYLPHHPVVRKDKTTTKLRVVYDASCKSQDYPSLNDCLYSGPRFDQSILEILLRFRVHPVGITADIEKAFLMIAIAPQDRNALRFLWPTDITEQSPTIQTYRFTRVVFGVTCSPFLLNATLHHHLQQYQDEDPQFVKTLASSLYVDDLTCGAKDEDSAYQLYSKSKLRLAQAYFNLRKFRTNCSSLQTLIDSQEAPQQTTATTAATGEEDQTYAKASLGAKGEEDGREEQKILGVRWDCKEDRLSLGVEELEGQLKKQTTPTKRNVVAAAAKIFDPLGLMAPTTVLWKMLFQEVCKAGTGWDEALSGSCLTEWKRLTAAMGEKTQLSIQRCYNMDDSMEPQLIGFCDASEKAYAAVIYLKAGYGETAEVQFVAAKTRVAPTKTMTIPRLELMSALLLSRLCHTTREALKDTMKLKETVCFTDSRVSLCWIQGVDTEWKTFVQNRVTTIRKIVPACQWKHCPGLKNPADIPSRGMLPQKLKEEKRWLEGPEWLRKTLEPSTWKGEEIPEECLQERKKNVFTLLTPQQETRGVSQLIDLEKYSDLKRLLKTTAAVLKFTHLTRGTKKESMELLQEAELLWLKEGQEELTTEKDFQNLQTQLGLKKDKEGLWRCHGRMENAQLATMTKEPILLGRRHHLTRLLIKQAHQRVLHSGCKSTLTELRAKYWVLKGRQAVKREIHNCPVCRRMEGPAFRSLPPPPLPAYRVQQDRPFSSIGLDFAGPLYVKGAQEAEKVWICVYTCCATRAIHLDLVKGLSTEDFLRSFRRFCGRRGVPSTIISDNALTFKAAEQELQALLADPQIKTNFEDLRISWKFITERAPWQGGVYERMVKLTKGCLRKSLGKKMLTYDELITLIIEVEAVLNSRPLSYIASDDLDEPLTPSHLITGHRILSLPDPTTDEESDPSYEPTPGQLTRRMKHLTALKNRFWRRWRLEYLQELREQHRRAQSKSGCSGPTSVGEPVVIYDENHPRGIWKLGRVQELIKSTDGEVRAARVVTMSGNGRQTLKRPIQHLHPLEVRSEVPAGNSDNPPEVRAADGRDQTVQEPTSQLPRPTRRAAQQARAVFREMSAQNLV